MELESGDILVGTTVDGRYKIIFRPVNETDPPLTARAPASSPGLRSGNIPPPRPPPPSVRTFATPQRSPPPPPPPPIVKEEPMMPDSPESPPPSPPFLVTERPAAHIEPVRQLPLRPPPPPPSAVANAPPSVEVTVERAEPIGVRVTIRSSGGLTSRIYPEVRPEPSAPPLDEEHLGISSRGVIRPREESPLPERNVRARTVEEETTRLARAVNTLEALNDAINSVEAVSGICSF